MQRVIAVFIAVCLLFSVGGCSSQQGGADPMVDAPIADLATDPTAPKVADQVTIELLRLGAPEKAGPIFEPIIAEFEKENPNIKVNFSVLGWAEANTKLKLLASSGKLPDVTFVNIINGYDLASEGLLMDIKPLLDADAELSADIPDAVKKAVEYDGKMYWVPSATGAYSLWYNKELFKKAGLDPNSPPKTVDEMIAFAEQITAKTGVPGLGFGAKALEDLAHVTMSFYSSYTGVNIWDSSTAKLTINDGNNRQLFIDALTAMQSIVDKGVTQPNPVEYNPFALRPLFRDEQIAMTIDGAWAVKEFLTELDRGEESKFATALFPAGPAGSKPIMGTDGWGIPADSKHPEEAWMLLKFLMRSDNQTTHATQWGLLPILNSEVSKEEFKAPYWKALMEQVPTVMGRPQNKNVAMIEQCIADAAQEVLLGKVTPEQAVDKIVKNVEADMQ